MPAEILRDKEVAGDPGPPPPPPAVESGEKPAPKQTLAEWYRSAIDTVTPKYEAAEKQAKESLEQRRKQLADLREKVTGIPAPPDAPEYRDAPESPVIRARPFLDSVPGEPWQQSLQKLMFGAGLMAQMAVGIKGGFPQGALAAYTGALRGWSEGDALRGANEWQTYIGQVKKYEQDVRSTQAKFENAMKTHGANQERLKTEFGILAAEQGLDREGIELAFREPDRLMANLTSAVKVMETMERDAANVAFKNLMYMQQAARDAEMAQYHRELIAAKRDAAQNRKDDKLRFAPAGGAFYDKADKTMKPAVPEGEFRANPTGFKSLAHTDIQLIDFIDTTKPQISRLKEIVGKLAAEQPGLNLYKALELAGQGRLAMSPELREAIALNRDLVVEMTRALGGGGQLRVTLMKALEKDVGFKTTDTTVTATRALQTIETALENRKRGILGEPLVEYGSPESRRPSANPKPGDGLDLMDILNKKK